MSIFFLLSILLTVRIRYCLFFFFFQAEDGIRDLTVTGVQTCALPISARRMPGLARAGPDHVHVELAAELGGQLGRARLHVVARVDRADLVRREDLQRSEERRVGEEGRSRWAPYH